GATAIITSANFTEAAQRRNIEVGIVVRHQPTIQRLVDYFSALRNSKQLVQCNISRWPQDKLWDVHRTSCRAARHSESMLASTLEKLANLRALSVKWLDGTQ